MVKGSAMEQHRELTATLPTFGEFLILVVTIMNTQLARFGYRKRFFAE